MLHALLRSDLNQEQIYHLALMLPLLLQLCGMSHNPAAAEDPETGHYTGSIYQPSENSIMNLGHGRCGHLPDYSFARYRYLPAWGDSYEIDIAEGTDEVLALAVVLAIDCVMESQNQTVTVSATVD